MFRLDPKEFQEGLELHNRVAEQLKMIEDNEGVNIEYGYVKDEPYLHVLLRHHQRLPFDLSVTNRQIDLYIGNTKFPLYEMSQLPTGSELEKFMVDIERILSSAIAEIIYASGAISIVDQHSEELMYSYKPVLRSLFGKGKVVDSWAYVAWLQD